MAMRRELTKYDEPSVVVFVWARLWPKDPNPTLLAAPKLFDELSSKVTRINYSTTKKTAKNLRYSDDNYCAVLNDKTLLSTSLHSGPTRRFVQVKLHLREYASHVTGEEGLYIVYNNGQELPPASVRSLLTSMLQDYQVVNGGACWFTDAWTGMSEATFGGADFPNQRAEARWKHDSSTSRRLAQKNLARRLYPITIFGPELWSRLPPMPAASELTHPIKLEDVAGSKVLTCWPTLTHPEDPAFLAGTQALRRWLWPHSIQNPADDPDMIDQMLAGVDTSPWIVEQVSRLPGGAKYRPPPVDSAATPATDATESIAADDPVTAAKKETYF
jgi:hypothetical protein